MNFALLRMAERPSRYSGPDIGRGCDCRKDHGPFTGRGCDRREDHEIAFGFDTVVIPK